MEMWNLHKHKPHFAVYNKDEAQKALKDEDLHSGDESSQKIIAISLEFQKFQFDLINLSL
jgi:hypothetical protein